MAGDRWYKRLLWFLFFSMITLLIFFILDTLFVKFTKHYTETGIEASFTKEEFTFVQGEKIVLTIKTNAKKYTVDVWIDEAETPFVFENETELFLDFASLDIDTLPAGTYQIKSTLKGKKFLTRQTEVLMETTLIIQSKE